MACCRTREKKEGAGEEDTQKRKYEKKKKGKTTLRGTKGALQEDEADKDVALALEICVLSWNINKSSAPYDFLCDVAQYQVNVAMFQAAQNWRDDGCAEEAGWFLQQAKQEGNAANTVKK